MTTATHRNADLAAEQLKLRRFVEKYPKAKLTGFYSCGGYSWEARDYRCIVLASWHRGNRHEGEAATFAGATARDLVLAMRHGGWLPKMSVARVGVLCESAASFPRPPRQRRSAEREVGEMKALGRLLRAVEARAARGAGKEERHG